MRGWLMGTCGTIALALGAQVTGTHLRRRFDH
jgi:hypothetical protein